MTNTALFSPTGTSEDEIPMSSPRNEDAKENPSKHPRVLTIAGSDPSGGAGIQADIKTISAHGGYALAAITALTAQNTLGVQAVHIPPVDFLRTQLQALSDDVTIDAVKVGMLGTAQVMEAVGDWLARTQPPVVVLDPVMVATSGHTLMAPDAREALLALLHQAHLVTPNIPELAALLDVPAAQTWRTAVRQGQELAVKYQLRVLVKGGHLPGAACLDALITPEGTVEEFSGPRVLTRNTHGTGCALSSAIAVLQADDGDWSRSVRRAKGWLGEALATGETLRVGAGAGPVNHLHALWAADEGWRHRTSGLPQPKQAVQPGQPDSAEAFSQDLWRRCAPQREAIFGLDFIQELASGTLLPERFAYYLRQDSLYLGAYSRVLARASVLAPNEAAQKFWAAGAQNCLQVELSLHQDWLTTDSGPDGHRERGRESCREADAVPGPVTKHYVDHLQGIAFSGTYGELVAAVLPCYWLYAEVGRVLHANHQRFVGDHPYGAWLESYADEEFARATAGAIDLLDEVARESTAAERQRMRTAFAHSAQYEVDFFAAPHHDLALGHGEEAGQITSQVTAGD